MGGMGGMAAQGTTLPGGAPPSTQEELDRLKEMAKDLRRQMESVESRIQDLGEA